MVTTSAEEVEVLETTPLAVGALDEAPDALVAARAADGDVRAFGVLVRRHTAALRAYARRVLGADTDADDVVQLTFVSAWQQLAHLEDPAAVKGWLFRIAHRNALAVLRGRRDHGDLDDHEQAGPSTQEPEARAEDDARQQALSGVLAALPEDQRRCWLLREVGGLGYAEIADELAVPASTVRGLLVRARRRVALEMEAWR